MPHTHLGDRTYTVISGVFYIGVGGSFDGDKVNAYPPAASLSFPGTSRTSSPPAPRSQKSEPDRAQ